MKAVNGVETQWESISVGLPNLNLDCVILTAINDNELLIFSLTFASPICSYDTKANTWRSAEGILKWSHDLGVEVALKARARYVRP